MSAELTTAAGLTITGGGPERPVGVFEVPDGLGGWREATDLEMILGLVSDRWAAAGQVPPEALLRRVCREYERGLWLPERALDVAA